MSSMGLVLVQDCVCVCTCMLVCPQVVGRAEVEWEREQGYEKLLMGMWGVSSGRGN